MSGRSRVRSPPHLRSGSGGCARVRSFRQGDARAADRDRCRLQTHRRWPHRTVVRRRVAPARQEGRAQRAPPRARRSGNQLRARSKRRAAARNRAPAILRPSPHPGRRRTERRSAQYRRTSGDFPAAKMSRCGRPPRRSRSRCSGNDAAVSRLGRQALVDILQECQRGVVFGQPGVERCGLPAQRAGQGPVRHRCNCQRRVRC